MANISVESTIFSVAEVKNDSPDTGYVKAQPLHHEAGVGIS